MLAGIACARGSGTGSEHGATATAAPTAVQRTWQSYGGPLAVATDVERDTEHGLETWSAEFTADEGTIEVTALGDGTLVSIEREVATDDAPAAVRDHAVRVLGAAPGSVDRVRLAVYEIEDRSSSGAIRERFVDPFGNVVLTRVSDPASEREEVATLDELPTSARAAIEREAGDAVVTAVEREMVGDNWVYSGSWQEADGARELKVLADGTVLSLELPTGELPARVVQLIENSAGITVDDGDGEDEAADNDQAQRRAADFGVERMLLDAWEAEVAVGDTVRQAVVLPTGELLGDVMSGRRAADDND